MALKKIVRIACACMIYKLVLLIYVYTSLLGFMLPSHELCTLPSLDYYPLHIA